MKKKWAGVPEPDQAGDADDELQDGEEEVDVVELPVSPGEEDDDGDPGPESVEVSQPRDELHSEQDEQ